MILGAEGKDQETSEKLSMALRISAQRQHWSLSLVFHQTKLVTWPSPPLMDMEIHSRYEKWHLDAEVCSV